ncbi:hypothetical protein V6N12_010538 [Hibiscus sabdariffa]|uniref:DUF4283 domain-containing protein n=1 Tax=Hibiscus sabdariffa TaxID=183260 RepID=A0ABR2EKS0_9ROSI
MRDSLERLDVVDARLEELDTQGDRTEAKSGVLEAQLEALRSEMLDLKAEVRVYQAAMKGDVQFGLVGKLLSPHLVNEGNVIRTFTNIWANEHAEVCPLKNGVFPFKFLNEANLLSILRRGPWLFDGEPIVLVPFNPTKTIIKHDFSKISYWIRIHELPLVKMTMEIAQHALDACTDGDKEATYQSSKGDHLLPSQPLWAICFKQAKPLIEAPTTIPLNDSLNPYVGISDNELNALASIANELGVTSTLGRALINDDLVKGEKPIDQLALSGIDPGTSKDETILPAVNGADLMLCGIDLGSSKATTNDTMLLGVIDHGTTGSRVELNPTLNCHLPSLDPMDGAASVSAKPALGLTETLKSVANMELGSTLNEIEGKKVDNKAPTNAGTGETDGTNGKHPTNPATPTDPAQLTTLAAARSSSHPNRSGSFHCRCSLLVGMSAVEPDPNDGSTPLSDSNQSTSNHKQSRHGKHRSSSSAKRSRFGLIWWTK